MTSPVGLDFASGWLATYEASAAFAARSLAAFASATFLAFSRAAFCSGEMMVMGSFCASA